MLELASQLSNPFGDDDVDFPIHEWMAKAVESAVMLLEDEGLSEDLWKKKLDSANCNFNRHSPRDDAECPTYELDVHDHFSYSVLNPATTTTTARAVAALRNTLPEAGAKRAEQLREKPGKSHPSTENKALCASDSAKTGGDTMDGVSDDDSDDGG